MAERERRVKNVDSLVPKCRKYLQNGIMSLRCFLDSPRGRHWNGRWSREWQQEREDYFGEDPGDQPHIDTYTGIVTDNFGLEAVPMLRVLHKYQELRPALQTVFDRLKPYNCKPSYLQDDPEKVELAFDKLARTVIPTTYFQAKMMLKSYLRLLFFMEKVVLKATQVPWPPSPQKPALQHLRFVSFQVDGSSKGKEKKCATQVFVPCYDKIAKKTETYMHPLPLQVSRHVKSKVTHMAARNRMIEFVRMLIAVLGAKKLEALADAKASAEMPFTIVFDADQEGTEQRALRVLGRRLPCIVRIGIHHRISNSSGAHKKVRRIRIALRRFTGGKLSTKTLRGGFEVARKSLLEAVYDGARPPDTAQIERETGKPVVEALENGVNLVSSVRTRWMGDEHVGIWLEENCGKSIAILKEQIRLGTTEGSHFVPLVAFDLNDNEMADAIQGDGVGDGMEEVDDFFLDPVAPVANAVAPMAGAMQNDEPEDAQVADDGGKEDDEVAASKMTDEQKMRSLLKALEDLSEGELSHFNRLRKPMLRYHQLHLRRTYGRQETLADVSDDEIDRAFPYLMNATTPAEFVLEATKQLPRTLHDFMVHATNNINNDEQLFQSATLMRNHGRHLIFEAYDPAFGMWMTFWCRENILPDDLGGQLKNLHLLTGRPPGKIQEQHQYWVADVDAHKATAKEHCSRAVLSGPASDSMGESFWRYASAQQRTTNTANRQYKISYGLHQWQKQITTCKTMPEFLQRTGNEPALPPANTFRDAITSEANRIKTYSGLLEALKPLRLQSQMSYVNYFENLENLQNDTQIPAAIMTKVVHPASAICLDTKTNHVDAHPLNYFFPGLEAYVALRDPLKRERKVREMLQQVAEVVINNGRFRHWLKSMGFLAAFDTVYEHYVLVLDVIRGLYFGMSLNPNAEGTTATLDDESVLVAGMVADCNTLENYRGVTYVGGRVVIPLASVWTTFHDSVRSSVDSLQASTLAKLLSYIIGKEVPDLSMEQEYRDLLRFILFSCDTDVAVEVYDEFMAGLHSNLDRLSKDDYERFSKNANSGLGQERGNAAARTFLGYCKNEYYWRIVCNGCGKECARVYKFERRASNLGRALIGQYKIPPAPGVAHHPTCPWPLNILPEARIKAAFFDDFTKSHEAQELLCPGAEMKLKSEQFKAHEKRVQLHDPPIAHVPRQRAAAAAPGSAIVQGASSSSGNGKSSGKFDVAAAKKGLAPLRGKQKQNAGSSSSAAQPNGSSSSSSSSNVRKTNGKR